uniref:ATP synthase F0 subunit 8 n=1 Tax=Hymenophyllum holochilum TaxID=2137820 RepID=A0A385KNV6_9MONI|nr:hypothetical protein [Hymenophyllum holochilum]AXZ96974.1 hypothetical protein [Hymenophyllum holochilum]
MSSVYMISQMFLYYPSFLFLLYIYVVFIIPLKSSLSIKRYWLSIKSYLEKDYLRFIDFLIGRGDGKR